MFLFLLVALGTKKKKAGLSEALYLHTNGDHFSSVAVEEGDEEEGWQ